MEKIFITFLRLIEFVFLIFGFITFLVSFYLLFFKDGEPDGETTEFLFFTIITGLLMIGIGVYIHKNYSDPNKK